MTDLLAALGRDRAKVPRRTAMAAAALLAVVATAAAGDWVLRARLHAAAHAAFAAARAQLGHALALRHETFSTLADLSLQLPILREVAGTKDLSDLGLGSREQDARDLATLHASLRDADWNAWASSVDRGYLAVADYKGRLLYATARPEAYGSDVRALGAVAAVYHTGGSAMQVIRADDDAVRASGLAPARPGLLLVFARAAVSGSVPQALFIQAIDARRLLADLTPGSDVRLSLVAPDGTAEGDVPPRVVAATPADEAWSDGAEWFVQSVPLSSAGRAAPIGAVVMARRADAGLAGLFPYARTVLGALGSLALAILGGALWTVRTIARERRTIALRLSPARFSPR